MASYITLSTLTDEGRKTIKEKPDRILEVNKELEKMGVKVKQQFAVFGPYDFVNIVEARVIETVMRMAVGLGGRGGLSPPTTRPQPRGKSFKKNFYDSLPPPSCFKR